MCMKNINTDIVLFDDAFPNKDNEKNIDLLGATRGIPLVHAKKAEEGILRIPKLDILFSISATEEIGDDSKPNHGIGENSENTFYMDEQYSVRLRVTETDSGQFVDLDTFNIDPSQDMISLCRRIYNQKGIYQYRNVPVAIPPEGQDLCALKVLIKKKDAQGKWIVQSMHPIQLIVEE